MNDRTPRILLVEDEEAHAGLIHRAFASATRPVELTEVGTLEEARSCLAESPPDLVITDLLLPDGQGVELLPDDKEEARFPVVVITGFGNEQAAVEAMRAGAVDYVVKSGATLAEMPRIAERALREWEYIAERRQFVEALRQAREQLEHRVEQRTAELARANSQLQREVEERRLAEEQLAVFRRFVEASGQGFGMADLDERIMYVNPTILRLCGEEDPQDMLGKNFMIYHPAEERQKLEEEILPTVMREGQWVGELTVRSASGELIPVIMNYFLIRDDRQNPSRLAVVITDISERKQAEEALRKEQLSLRQMLEMLDRERQLTAYEIHDGLAQYLTAAKMQLQAFEQLKQHDPAESARAFHAGIRMLSRGISEARRLISGLRPPILDEAGAVAAIEHLVCDARSQEGLEIELVIDVQFGRLEPLLESALFRIVQEGLTNARRHSKSSKVRVELTQQHDRIRIEVRDWGIGFDPENVQSSCFGLEGVRERARLLGGHATIESTAGKGTRVFVEVPLREGKAGPPEK